MKLSIKNIILLFLVAVFLAGFIVLLNNGINNHQSNSTSAKCPNLLVRNGNKLSLLDSNKKQISSFDDLEEYKKYLEVQNKKGIYCPVLYIQEENNTQGTDIYKMYSNPFEIEPGLTTMSLSSHTESMGTPSKPIEVLDANRDNSPYNANNYPGFDPSGLNVGDYTTVDAAHDSTKNIKNNDNAMDSNWQAQNR